jgi:hypothetical protein
MIVPGNMAHDSFSDEDFIVLKEVIQLSADPLLFQAGKWQGQTDVKDLIDTGHLNKEAQPDNVKSCQEETNDSNNAKEIHTIYVLKKTDGTAFGWTFLGFYDIRECIRSICNRNSGVTTLGSKNFKPFTNLSLQWVLNLELADKIWVIHIDATKSYIEGSFPMIAHVTFANKIA